MGLPRVNWNIVYHPVLYSITAMDEKAKHNLDPAVLFYDLVASRPVENWRQNFLELTAKLDKQRKQSLNQSLPELYNFLH